MCAQVTVMCISSLKRHALCRFNVTHMFAPLDTDLLLGATKQRQLVIWQYNQVSSISWDIQKEGWCAGHRSRMSVAAEAL